MRACHYLGNCEGDDEARAQTAPDSDVPSRFVW